MRSLYRNASIISTVFFIAVISVLNVDTSTELWLFLNQIIGALLQK